MRYEVRTVINGIRKGADHKSDGNTFQWRNRKGVKCSLHFGGVMPHTVLYSWDEHCNIISSLYLPTFTSEEIKTVERAFLRKMLGL